MDKMRVSECNSSSNDNIRPRDGVMCINQRLVASCALAYLLLPNLLFLLGWCQSWVSVPLSVALVVAAVCASRKVPARSVVLSLKNTCFLIIALLVCALWCHTISLHGNIWQADDFILRNAVYESLVRCDWPLFSNTNEYFVYYLAYWLPPAFVAKLALPWGDPYAFLFVWIYMGMVLSVLLIALRWPGRTLTFVLILYFLSSLAYLGYYARQKYGEDSSPLWSYWLPWICQYTDSRQQLTWTYNHIPQVWLFLAFFFSKSLRGHQLLFPAALIVTCSPLCAVGLFPFLVWKLFSKRGDILRAAADGSVWVGVLLVICAGAYLVSGNGSDVKFMLAHDSHVALLGQWDKAKTVFTMWDPSSPEGMRAAALVPQKIVTFLIEVGAMLIPTFLFLYKPYKSTKCFWYACSLIVVLPLICVGYQYNELLFKACAVSYALLACLFVSRWHHASVGMKLAITIYLFLTSFHALVQLSGLLKWYTWDEQYMAANRQNQWEGHLNHQGHMFYEQLVGERPSCGLILYTKPGESAEHVLKVVATGRNE